MPNRSDKRLLEIRTIGGAVLLMLLANLSTPPAFPADAVESKSESPDQGKTRADLNQQWDELEQWAEQAFIDGKKEEARKLWMKALLFAQENGQELNAATTLNQLNHLFVETGEYAEAFSSLTQALEIRERLLGKEHILTAESLGNLALINHKLGHDKEAEDLYNQSLAIKDNLLGSDSPESAVTLHNLAELYSKHRQYEQARRTFDRALSIDRKHNGENDVEVVRDLISLGINSYRCRKWEEARSHLEDALKRIERGEDSDKPETRLVKEKEKLSAFHYLGLCQARLGDHKKAREYYALAREIGHRLHGKHHPANTMALINLGRSSEELGENQEAEKLFMEALAHEKSRDPVDPFLLTRCNLELGHYYHRQDMSDQAEQFYRDALKTYKDLEEHEQRKLYELPAAMADLLRKTGNKDEAEEVSRRYLQIHTPHRNEHFRFE
ncbi:MAG: tetratricopeptide repeat protein [Candidatus Melainabacteria bacterium]|nr:tetratricopeptide repeat protein [Candidatus Melainabacteria bacterium]